jgi:transposase
VTGLRIIRAILAGERDCAVLARLRDSRCHATVETIENALTGNYRAEHLFALEQALALFDTYQEKGSACDTRIGAVLKNSVPIVVAKQVRCRPSTLIPSTEWLDFDVRAALFALLGKDLTQINGLGPYVALKLSPSAATTFLPGRARNTSPLGYA